MFKVSEIASWIQAAGIPVTVLNSVAENGPLPQLTVQSMKTLKEAGPQDLAFFFSKHYQDELVVSRAGVIITGNAFVKPLGDSGLSQWKTATWIVCEDPYGALAVVSREFSRLQSAHDHQDTEGAGQIHPSAVVDSTAKIGKGVVIYAHCYVGPHCEIGEHSVLFHRVTLYEKTVVGRQVRIHAGAVIGADGFGYAPIIDPSTKKQIGHRKIYHLGRVVIEDEVEIGANSTIDRGTLGDTIIRKQAKIDNQVQVGHNCEVGEGSVLCGASGMAGSSSLGKFVMVGAQGGTGNQVHVGDYSRLAAYTGAAKDVPIDSDLCGMPARPIRDFFKLVAMQNKMLKDRQK